MTWTAFLPSDKLRKAIIGFEGYRQKAYQDSKGIWTIGVGHTKGVKKGMWISRDKVEEYLTQDLSTASNYINGLRVCKTQGQFDALVDFVFNLGIGSFSNSTLYKYIKAGKPTADIQAQFKRWVYAGKVILSGLVKRRDWEAQRWAEKD